MSQGQSLPGPGVVDHAKVFAMLPTGFLLLSPDLVLLDANEAFLAAVGRERDEIVGRGAFEVFPATADALDADGRPRIQVSMERARDTGRPDTMPVQKYDVPDTVHGGYMERWWSIVNVPLLDADGRTWLIVQRAEDVTAYVSEREARDAERLSGEALRERVGEVEADLFTRVQELRAALEDRDQAARRLAGLADVALLLATVRTEQELSDVVVGSGLTTLAADGGVLAVLDGSRGRLRLVVAGGLGPGGEGYPDLPVDGPLPASRAVATGEAVLLPDLAAGLAYAPGMAEVHESTGREAWASLPLVVGGRTLGSLTVSWTDPHPFSAGEVEVLGAFAAQCAQALERLQVRSRETRLSETLQRSLLTAPPEPDHLQIVVRYQPAAREAQVGGDWYDAFLLPDGCTTLVVGDVTGHDRNAAAAMGQLRNVLRGVAQSVEQPPAAVLSALDRALGHLGVDALATAVLVRVEQDAGERAAGLRRVQWSNAGHPAPLLLHADGRAELLERRPDLMLGLDPGTDRSDHEVELEADTTLLLYTDGLVERRGESVEVGLERLRLAAERHAALPAEQLCDALLADLASDPEDDVALLAVRMFPEDRPRPAEAGPEVLPGRSV